MNSEYKSALDKIHLEQQSKEEMKQLFRKGNMRKGMKFVKSVVAVAACMALVVGLGQVGSFTSDKLKSNNSFSIQVNAQTLEKGKSVLNDKTAFMGVVCENEDSGVKYSVDFPVTCKGDNIEKVTYSIKGAVFQVSNPENKSVIIDGKKAEKSLSLPANTAEKPYENNNEEFVINQYKSYTVDYNKQSSDTSVISIGYDSKLLPGVEKNIDAKVFGEDINTQLKAYNDLYKNVSITCKVTYKDGSVESKNIKVKAVIGKASDISNGEQYLNKDEDTIITTYTVE